MTASQPTSLDLSHLAPSSQKLDDDLRSISSQVDTATERAYGTFEVSLIDVESDSEAEPLKAQALDTEETEHHHTFASDCCALVTFLWLPVRLDTYKHVVFHFANLIIAAVAAAWTTIVLLAEFLVRSLFHGGSSLQLCLAASLDALLHVEAAMCNFVSPRFERIVVHRANSARPTVNEYNTYLKIYFSAAKLTCSAVPGAVSALAFIMSIKNLIMIITASDATETNFPVERDVLILLAVVMVYAAASLMKAFVVISRHITFFFCADHFLQTA